MLWQRLQNEKSRWRKTDDVIDSWLKERQALLEQLIAISKLPALEGRARTPAIQVVEKETIRAFCATLLDYVSVLHFEILEQLAEIESQVKQFLRQADQPGQSALGLNRALLEKILKTTNKILDLEQQIQDSLGSGEDIAHLKEPLSLLGEQLAERMDLEDALIHAYVWARTALPNLA